MNAHDFDQSLAGFRDTLPRIWWATYRGCLLAGFGEAQAMALTQAYILSQCPAGIRAADAGGAPPRE